MTRPARRPDPLVFALSTLMVPTCAVGAATMLVSSVPWVTVVWLVAAVVFFAAAWVNRPRNLGLWAGRPFTGACAGFTSWCAGSCSWCWPGVVEVGLHYPARWASPLLLLALRFAPLWLPLVAGLLAWGLS